MSSQYLTRKVIGELLAFTMRTLVFWYILAVFIEMVLPGFVSSHLNLDMFLWSAIIAALFSLLIDPSSLFPKQSA